MSLQKIKFVDMEKQFIAERNELQKIFDYIFTVGNFVNGSSIEELENRIANYIGVKYVICVNSGTDALILGMKALGIGPGDEVITPPNSFVASTSSIIHVGARPVFADVSEDQNIDPECVKSVITPRTKAIMPVHLTGRIANMRELRKIADQYKLLIIEDAAQSFGSKYDNQYSGTIGNIGCFSVHPLKVFNAAGDGGFVTTNDPKVADKIKIMRNHGMKDRNTVLEWGHVSRMDTFQAEILKFRLTQVQSYIENRRKNVELYRKLLKNNHKIFIPACKSEEYNSFQTFVIQAEKRDLLQKYLKEQGIESMIHYPIPIHLQTPSKKFMYKQGDFPVTEKLADMILTIPNHQYMSQSEIEYVAKNLNNFYAIN